MMSTADVKQPVHKCKAWHKDRKCMIQADDFYFSQDELEPFVDTVQRAMEEFDLLWWSGLYDCDGVEIYQGDITQTQIMILYHSLHMVVWNGHRTNHNIFV